MVSQHFNDKLTEDPAKRIALSGTVYSQFSIGDLIDTANDVKRRSQADKSRCRQKFDNILNWFRQYGQVVDVMIQHQPEITALVWGSIRLLLTVMLARSLLVHPWLMVTIDCCSRARNLRPNHGRPLPHFEADISV